VLFYDDYLCIMVWVVARKDDSRSESIRKVYEIIAKWVIAVFSDRYQLNVKE
jgi:hypothetical protein